MRSRHIEASKVRSLPIFCFAVSGLVRGGVLPTHRLVVYPLFLRYAPPHPAYAAFSRVRGGILPTCRLVLWHLSHPPSYFHNLEPSSRRCIAHTPPRSLAPYLLRFAPPILPVQPRASFGPSPRRCTIHMPPCSIASFSSFRDPRLGQWVHCPLTRTALSSVRGGVSPTHRLVRHVCSCIHRYCR